MTWWRDEKGYEVFFNRDELKTRTPATPPELLESHQGVRYLSPHDPVAGGTWMLANEHGVCVCLLNRWHEKVDATRSYQSRGLLVTSMADCCHAKAVIDRLQSIEHHSYRPFTLVAIDHDTMHVSSWNGETLANEAAEPPLTSSSYCFPEVSAARIDAYARLAEETPEHLARYQQGESTASAFTVRMNRPDAQTWSRSHLRVNRQSIHWSYIEEMPDLSGEGIIHQRELLLK